MFKMMKIFIYTIAVFVGGCSLTSEVLVGDYQATIIGYWENEDINQASLEFLESDVVKIHHPIYENSCVQFGVVEGEWKMNDDNIKFSFISELDTIEYIRHIHNLNKNNLKLKSTTDGALASYNRKPR